MSHGLHLFCGSRHGRSPVGRTIGFTLIELLVVVTVILMASAIGIPCVRVVKEGAMKTACMGKLRQLYAGQVGYSMDWKGFILPTSATDPVTRQFRSYWNTSVMNDYLERNTTGIAVQMNRDVYGCQKARTQHKDTYGKQTYGQNDNIQEFGWRLTGMATPSSTVFIGDGAFVKRSNGDEMWFEMIEDMGTSTNPYSPVNATDDMRFPDGPHDGSQIDKSKYSLDKSNKANFVFMDGHAEGRLWSKIPTYYTSTFWKLR